MASTLAAMHTHASWHREGPRSGPLLAAGKARTGELITTQSLWGFLLATDRWLLQTPTRMSGQVGRRPGSFLQLTLSEWLPPSRLKDIYEASRPDRLSAPFSVGGTLGCLPVKLAVGPVPAASGQGAGQTGRKSSRLQAAVGAAEDVAGPSTSAEGPDAAATVVDFPSGGERDLAALLGRCLPAAFGKGSKTVRDELYRTALALPAARLFTHQLELVHLNGVLDAVHRLLLPATARVSARLHALNAYKKGGFFKPHRDTPRGDPGFVASLVVCLPVAHAGGALRVEHSGRSVTYDWGAGAAAGEVQWAAFFSDCIHEVMPVTSGTRVTLAYELFAHPDTSSAPEPVRALSDGASELAHVLGAALTSSSFMVNGGKIGFACQHAYPQSLLQGNSEQDIRSMLKGADAAVLHTLALLGVPTKLVRVWDTMVEGGYCSEEEEEEGQQGAMYNGRPLYISDLRPSKVQPGYRLKYGEEWPPDFLEKEMGARRDRSIAWLGGQDAFPQWTLGAVGLFMGNEGTYPGEFYCTLGIVAEVAPYDSRPTVDRAGWAGTDGAAAGGGAPGEASAGAESGASKGKRRRSSGK